MFPLPEVANVLDERVVEARLHTDSSPNLEENLALQQRFSGTRANPVYVIVDPGTEEVLGKAEGFHPAGSFLEFLDSVAPRG